MIDPKGLLENASNAYAPAPNYHQETTGYGESQEAKSPRCTYPQEEPPRKTFKSPQGQEYTIVERVSRDSSRVVPYSKEDPARPIRRSQVSNANANATPSPKARPPPDLLGEYQAVLKENRQLTVHVRQLKEHIDRLSSKLTAPPGVSTEFVDSILNKYNRAIQYAIVETVRLAMSDFRAELHKQTPPISSGSSGSSGPSGSSEQAPTSKE